MIERLETRSFRNLQDGAVDLAAQLVIVEGANAQGKTSLLEAAYAVATTRSFRTREIREAIRHGAEEAGVRALVGRGGHGRLELGLTVRRERGGKALFVGELPVKLPEYIGLVPALALAGDSVRAMKGSPAERRRFIDRAAAAARPEHIKDLGEYRRALGHRNQLLREAAPDVAVAPWDEILARTGERIASRRREELVTWQAQIDAWPALFPEGGDARLSYRRAGGDDLLAALRQARENDRRLRQTTVGPHRDDLRIDVGGRDLLRFGSAGQVRAALAAITLAQLRAVRQRRPEAEPLLVLDDVETDLDADRQQALLSAARDEAQTLASTTERDVAQGLDPLRLSVEQGRVAPGA